MNPQLLFRVATLAAFLFPITVATINGAGSGIWSLLLLLALVFGRGWSELDAGEKKVLLGFVVLLGVMALSLLGTEELSEGVKRLERFLRLALLVPVYLMFRRFSFKLGPAFAYGALLAGPVLALQGWYQVEQLGLEFAQGYYHKIVFGDLAMLAGVLAVMGAAFVADTVKLRLAFLMSAMLSVYASFLSGTRGAWILLPILGVFLLWLYRGRLDRRVWGVLGGGVLLVGLIAANTDAVHHGVESGVSDLRVYMENPSAGTSWGIRLNLWRNSLLIAQESPFLGTGIGDFLHDMKVMAASGVSLNPHVANFGHAHSIYFDALATSGILGLIALVVVLFFLPFVYFYRYWSPDGNPSVRFYSLGGMIFLVSFAVFGLTEGWMARNPFVVSYIMCLLVFMGGLANTLSKESRFSNSWNLGGSRSDFK